MATTLSVELVKNAVQAPGPEIEHFQHATADAQAYVVLGVCEKLAGTFGTLDNTQVFHGPRGSCSASARS